MNIQQIATDPDPYAPYLLSQGIRIGGPGHRPSMTQPVPSYLHRLRRPAG